jgi:hypothetical protein
VCGFADGTAAITAYSPGGESSGDGRRFPAAGTSGRASQIPGIIRSAVKEVVGFPCHEQLGRVGDAKNHGSRGSQTRDQGRILGCDVSGTQARARFRAMAGHIDGTFYGEWNAMQGADFVSLLNGFLGCTGLRQHQFRLPIDECVQSWIQAFNPIEVDLSNFDRRYFFVADLGCDLVLGGRTCCHEMTKTPDRSG